MPGVQRRYPPCPLVGVGVLVVEGDRILLVKRESDPGKGRWSIPGGLLEVGEPLRDGAKRETKEETGIDTEIDDLLDVIDNIVRDEEGKVCYHYVLIDFLGHQVGGQLQPGTDVREAQWASIHELDALTTTRTLRRLVEKAKLLK
jgi:ADP-ribose pyrophosphatase YjhB (NUDIX family)